MPVNLVQLDSGALGMRDEAAGFDVQVLGGPATALTTAPRYHGVQYLKVPLSAADTAGGILSVANPFGKSVFVTHVLVHTTTKATGACTADFGVAANGTTLSDVLLDGVDLGTATGLFDNTENQGTNGTSRQLWSSTQFVTGSMATGAAAGIVGSAYIGVVIP